MRVRHHRALRHEREGLHCSRLSLRGHLPGGFRQRNGKSKLLWIPDKTASLAYEPKADEMLLTVHRWFANKSCPGDWLYNRLGALAWQVTDLLSPKEKTDVSGDGNTPHDWAVDAFRWAVENGILRGSSGDKEDYRLNDPVTREEMITMLYRHNMLI